MNRKGDSKKSEQVNVARPTRRIAALLGFLLKAEADAIFKQHPFETTDGADPLELWRQYNHFRPQLLAVPDGKMKPLPASVDSLVDQVKKRPTYKKHYEAKADHSLMLAPISSLLAPQWFVDLDYIDELASRLNKNPTLEDQLLFSVTEGRITEPIVRGNQVLFTSPRQDLSADPVPFVRETDAGEFEIVVRASSRPNYIWVVQIADRLLLANGVHKVCALQKLGFDYCPCVFRKADTLAELGLNPWGFFRDETLKTPLRLALVTDFLNEKSAAALTMRSMYQVLQVSIGVGTMNVPALPPDQVNRGT